MALGIQLFGTAAALTPSCKGQGQPQCETCALKNPIAPDEASAAFCILKCRMNAGINAIKAEFLLNAEDILTWPLAPLAMLFTQMLTHGVPPSWCSGMIHPVFRSGDVAMIESTIVA